MQRLAPFGLLLLVLLTALWFQRGGERSRERPTPATQTVDSRQASPTAPASLAAASAVETESLAGRRRARNPSDGRSEREFRGRLVIPSGTPADESLRVRAYRTARALDLQDHTGRHWEGILLDQIHRPNMTRHLLLSEGLDPDRFQVGPLPSGTYRIDVTDGERAASTTVTLDGSAPRLEIQLALP